MTPEEIKRITEKAMDGIHWNDFDAEHAGQRPEIEKAIHRAIRLAIPADCVVCKREDVRMIAEQYDKRDEEIYCRACGWVDDCGHAPDCWAAAALGDS